MREPPNTAVGVAVGQSVLLLQIARDCGVILDDFAVIIGDANGSLRANREVDRVKPNIARREKFRLRLARRAADFEERSVATKESAVDEVLRRGAGEDLAAQPRQGGVPVDERRAGGGEEAVGDRLGRAVVVAVIFAEAGIGCALGAPRVRLADRERGVVVCGVAA